MTMHSGASYPPPKKNQHSAWGLFAFFRSAPPCFLACDLPSAPPKQNRPPPLQGWAVCQACDANGLEHERRCHRPANQRWAVGFDLFKGVVFGFRDTGHNGQAHGGFAAHNGD